MIPMIFPYISPFDFSPNPSKSNKPPISSWLNPMKTHGEIHLHRIHWLVGSIDVQHGPGWKTMGKPWENEYGFVDLYGFMWIYRDCIGIL